ncbi:MAG: glycosyltransferase, partial [Candidatus Caldatribacterium sp.]|nr:glycosyltransferase [Candidatus Caldatribacterium sp.]
MLQLNIGCGDRMLKGFINIDIEGHPDLQIDVRKGLPFPDESVDRIFVEHFIERLTRDEGILFLKEAYRVLKPGGVCRIATSDLSTIVKRYIEDDWQSTDWFHRFRYEWIPNRCVMLNVAMREQGYQHVYDFEDLRMVGNLAGFLILRRKSAGESDFPELRNLERCPESLVVEFMKESPEYQQEIPLVSICIPAYNPRFFKEALLSALNQKYSHFEIVVSDDSGGEEIQKIVASFSDERIRYFKNPKNIGAWNNYIQCLLYASGKYIKYLNDDDILLPQCVKTMVSYMEAYGTKVSLVTSKRDRIDERGNILPDTPDTRLLVPKDAYIRGFDLGDIVLAGLTNVIGEPTTVMFRKEDPQGFVENFKRFYDDQPG